MKTVEAAAITPRTRRKPPTRDAARRSGHGRTASSVSVPNGAPVARQASTTADVMAVLAAFGLED